MEGGHSRIGNDVQRQDVMDNETTGSQRISRRDALRRGAVLGGALVWAAPTVQSIGMRGAFAQVGTFETCICESTDRLAQLTVEYQPESCTTATSDPCAGCNDQGNDVPPDDAWIIITGNNIPATQNGFTPGTAFQITKGQRITIRYRCGGEGGTTANTFFDIYDGNPNVAGVSRQYVTVHTSCSETLQAGDECGSITVIQARCCP